MKNMIICGESRTNKTEGYIKPMIDDWQGGVLIFDSPKNLKDIISKKYIVALGLENLYVLSLEKLNIQIDEIVLALISGKTIIIYRKDKTIDNYILRQILLKLYKYEEEVKNPILLVFDEMDGLNLNEENIGRENHLLTSLLELNERNICTTIMAFQDIKGFKKKYKKNYSDIFKLCDTVFTKTINEYSGELRVRFPKSLHKELAEQAEVEGVSLNQYLIYLLTKNMK